MTIRKTDNFIKLNKKETVNFQIMKILNQVPIILSINQRDSLRDSHFRTTNLCRGLATLRMRKVWINSQKKDGLNPMKLDYHHHNSSTSYNLIITMIFQVYL